MTADIWLGAPEGESHFDVATLSASDRDRHIQMRGTRRRQEFAVSRALIAASQSPEPAATSLSHSGGWAAVARTLPNFRVGVDMEVHRPRDVLGLARFAFDSDEIAELEAIDIQARAQHFYALWTMKEAMAKALGVPLLTATRDCIFQREGAQWRGVAPTPDEWRLWTFEPRPGMALSVVIIGSEVPNIVRTHEWPIAATKHWSTFALIKSDPAGVGQAGLGLRKT